MCGTMMGGWSSLMGLFHIFIPNCFSYVFQRGGSAETVSSKGGSLHGVEARDQEEGHKSVRALINTHKNQLPIALFIDDKYKLFPYDLEKTGVVYALLGVYWISHAWGMAFIYGLPRLRSLKLVSIDSRKTLHRPRQSCRQVWYQSLYCSKLNISLDISSRFSVSKNDLGGFDIIWTLFNPLQYHPSRPINLHMTSRWRMR